jgi:Las17-binding protein actin regulator
MKFIKSIFAILLLSFIVFSCKSEKKDTEAVTEEEVAVEEVTETPEETTMEISTDSIEVVAHEEVVENKKITVVYPKDTDLANEVKKAIKSLVNDNPTIENHFNEAYGFAIFPVITKAGLGIGGAGGKGLVFEDKTVIGRASLAQATLGLQAGGQQYQEVVFFENKEALDKFKAGKIKFSGQASAVALKAGASTDIDYQDGVAIFTKVKGGIMAEASVGGQNFKYKDGI